MPKRPTIPREMKNALKSYDKSPTAVLQAFVTKMEAAPLPPMIYHYTNDVGLKGILDGGQLWFSDIFGLNDPSELRHGLSVAIRALRSRITDARPEVATFASALERFGVDAGIEAAGQKPVSPETPRRRQQASHALQVLYK